MSVICDGSVMCYSISERCDSIGVVCDGSVTCDSSVTSDSDKKACVALRTANYNSLGSLYMLLRFSDLSAGE